jgi:branched-chain amino acid transport system permease protein
MRPVDLMRKPALPLGAVAAVVVPWVVTMGLSSYWIYLTTSATVVALLCLSVGVVFGRAGMAALCPMAFAAIGALATALANHWQIDLPFPVLLLAAGLVTVPFGVAIGLPALRLRGLNLAIVTLGFAVAVDVVTNTVGFPGAETLEVIPRPDWATEDSDYFLLCWVVFVAASAALSWYGTWRGGAAWLAVRSSDRATAATGLAVPRVKLTAFAVSAFLAGVAGSLLAGQLGQLNATGFGSLQSLTIFTLAVMVGARHPEGAALGGMLAAFLPEVLRQVGLPQDLAGVVFAVGAVIGLRSGAGGAAADLRAAGRRFLGQRARPAAASGAHASGPAVAATPGPEPSGSDMPASVPVLDARNLSVGYGAVTALDDVSIEVRRGELHALIGPNGAGKSTFVDVVSGFVRPGAGSVTVTGSVAIDGQDHTLAPVHLRARAGLRRTFQHERTIGDLTVAGYLRLVAPAATPGEAEALLDQFGCPPGDVLLSAVDVGRRRLVEVAGAVLSRPSVLLLDEPAAGLDAEESQRLGRLLAGIPAAYGLGVLLIEHDVEMVASISDRVTVLDFGRVIASGPAAQVLRDPIVLAAYVGEEVPV